jgi:3,4-dihydroxy 2-butanone 4-phosphate synthase/GTP cyclohydrolase II
MSIPFACLRTDMHNTTSAAYLTEPRPIPLSVSRVATAELPTAFGTFDILGYRSRTSDEEFVALVKGDVTAGTVLVRIHSQCVTGEVFQSDRCDCGPQMRKALSMITEEGRGALVYQLQDGRGIGTVNKIRTYALQDNGVDTVEANVRLGFAPDLRDYRQCAEIFLDLGISRVRVMTNNPLKLAALEELGFEVVSRVPLEIEPSRLSIKYLRTKVRKMGHLLDL